MTCKPLHARFWFRRGFTVCFISSLIASIFLLLVLRHFTQPLIAAALAIVCSALTIWLLPLHPEITVKCTTCRQWVKANTPWLCGFNECRNENVDEFPVVHRCQHCGAEPKAYQCHHCGELIFFTDDLQKTNYARCVNSAFATDPHQDKLTQTRRDIELAELNLKKAQAEAAARHFSKASNPETPKGVKDRLRSKVGSKTELDDEVMSLKAEIDEQFKDDPDERERRHRIIDDEARDLLG